MNQGFDSKIVDFLIKYKDKRFSSYKQHPEKEEFEYCKLNGFIEETSPNNWSVSEKGFKTIEAGSMAKYQEMKELENKTILNQTTINADNYVGGDNYGTQSFDRNTDKTSTIKTYINADSHPIANEKSIWGKLYSSFIAFISKFFWGFIVAILVVIVGLYLQQNYSFKHGDIENKIKSSVNNKK